jgi:hypothetical protein
MDSVSHPIHLKAAAGSAGAIAAYAFSQGGTAALGSNLMYPIIFSAGSSVVYDTLPMVSQTFNGLVKGDSRMGRAAYIFAMEVGGLMVMYPALSMQERLLFGALGAVGSYVMS